MKLLAVMKELFLHRDDVVSYFHEKSGNWYPKTDRNRALEPFRDNLLVSHLAGHMQIGFYSTKRDPQFTVKWVVGDFDDNLLALDHCLETRDKLSEYDIPAYIERSMSGRGYHLWVFFDKPVPAKDARRFMLNALHLAGVPTSGRMQKGGNSKRSYDRLFPSQSYLGAAGYGNLIRVPLYGKAIVEGNCCFIEDDGRTITDHLVLFTEIIENGRVSLDHEGIKELMAVEGPKDNSAKPPAETEQDYWQSLSERDDISERLNIMRGCEALKAGFTDANLFNEPSWKAVMTNLAMYGPEAEDIAHEWSKGYDMRQVKNDSEAVYSQEDTEQKFQRSLDNARKGQIPNSCASLADRGWECPNLTSCDYRFIAQYGMPPSETVFPATKEQQELMRVVEEHGLYEVFEKRVLINDNVLVCNEDEKDFFPPGARIKGVFERRSINKFDLARHMVQRPIKIDVFSADVNSKVLYADFDNRKDLAKFIKVAKSYKIDFFVESLQLRIWLFPEKSHSYGQSLHALSMMFKKIGIELSVNDLSVQYSYYGSVIPPFSKNDATRGIRFLQHLKGEDKNVKEEILESNSN
ncbi:hypothetical protein D3C78_19170 [compost metagenome]